MWVNDVLAAWMDLSRAPDRSPFSNRIRFLPSSLSDITNPDRSRRPFLKYIYLYLEHTLRFTQALEYPWTLGTQRLYNNLVFTGNPLRKARLRRMTTIFISFIQTRTISRSLHSKKKNPVSPFPFFFPSLLLKKTSDKYCVVNWRDS